MATTSGTVGQFKMTVGSVIDTAFRRCGKAPSTVSGELLEAAITSLSMLLADFANEGVNLFCIRKSVLNVRPNTAQYPMAEGTEEILNVMYRTLVTPFGVPTISADAYQMALDAPVAIGNVSGVFAAGGTCSLVIEYNNGAGWKPLTAFGQMTVDAGTDFATDITRPEVSALWRIRDTSGNNVVPTPLFRTVRDELNMSQLNRDDYVNLPDKTRVTGANQKSLQFWYDKQINPSIFFWPIANNPLDQIIIYQHGLIEDVGRLTNLLAVPNRWYEAVVFTLASKLSLEIPPQELPPGRLEMLTALAQQHTLKAGRRESDGSSYRLQPQIRGYTC